jgi:putative endonuclease
MMSLNNRVIYFGVTNNLIRRVFEHKNKTTESFTQRYNVVKLVYFEIADTPQSVINREKQIKGGSRKKKLELIKDFNPDLKDLYAELL